MGVVGPAIATLISYIVYNSIRYLFLLRKFNMQPFNSKTVSDIPTCYLSAICLSYLLFSQHTWIFCHDGPQPVFYYNIMAVEPSF